MLNRECSWFVHCQLYSLLYISPWFSVCSTIHSQSKEWHLKGAEWGVKSVTLFAGVSPLDLDTRSSYSELDGTQRPHLSCVTSWHLRHICVTSLLLFMSHCQGQGRCLPARCNAFPPKCTINNNVIVSFNITLFSTFTTHNYTDEEKIWWTSKHYNLLINV